MGSLTRRKPTAKQQQLHPGGAPSRQRRRAAEAGLPSVLPLLPAVVVAVAVAVGAGVGLIHKHQGMDLADSIADLVLGNARAGPVPSVGTREGKAKSKGASTGLAGPVTVQIHANGASEPAGNMTLRPEQHRSVQALREAAGGLVAGCGEDGEEACRVFTEFGYEVKALSALRDGQRLFLVPDGRHFVWPTFGVGHRVQVPGVASAYPGKAITLETVSESPRVFLVENFFSEKDADDLIEFTLGIDDNVYGLKRSTTGAKGAEVSSQRTSENAFDTSSPVAKKLKHRVFEVLGMRPYNEEMADGLQVLRYNVSKAYIPHLDYLELDSGGPTNHDFDSSGEGTNRFATMLLYLNTVEEGGQTVFPHAARSDGSRLKPAEGLKVAKERGWTKGLAPGGWEERMMGECAGRLAIQPRKAMAVLFYSQHPDGRVDRSSLHGACPVVQGQKWAANLWVWNGPRYGYNPRTKQEQSNKRGHSAEEGQQGGMDVEFSSGSTPAQLFWRGPGGEDVFFGELGESPLRMHTFAGHTWVLKSPEGLVLRRFKIEPGMSSYRLA